MNNQSFWVGRCKFCSPNCFWITKFHCKQSPKCVYNLWLYRSFRRKLFPKIGYQPWWEDKPRNRNENNFSRGSSVAGGTGRGSITTAVGSMKGKGSVTHASGNVTHALQTALVHLLVLDSTLLHLTYAMHH